ncbi:hypothetical protein CYY_004611 [Polysphondylium violaceum]|uniref:Ankyrin repeat protein n=1 Tax=Polysphondylium violaceum TaxID=133409 RepID=A0A8J4PWA6_9MYCE|nr:hypothetical protein CYY_004611 [Polysphondylium violaceum]
MEYKFYSLVFNNNFISAKIFKIVNEIQKNRNSLKYTDIDDVGWMINNNHLGILSDKIKSGQVLSLNINRNRDYLKVICGVRDQDLFIWLFDRFPEFFSIDDVILQCLNDNLIEPIKTLFHKGYLYNLKPPQFLNQVYKTITPVKSEIIGLLLECGYFDTEYLYKLNFNHIPSSLDLIIQSLHKPLDKIWVKRIWELVLQSGHPSIFTNDIQQILQGYSVKLEYCILKNRNIRDLQLFLFLWNNNESITIDNKKEWLFTLLKSSGDEKVLMLKTIIENDQTFIINDKDIENTFQIALDRFSQPMLEYLFEWKPNYMLNDFSISIKNFNPEPDALPRLDFEFLCKLMDKGFDAIPFLIKFDFIGRHDDNLFLYRNLLLKLFKKYRNRFQFTEIEHNVPQIVYLPNSWDLGDIVDIAFQNCCTETIEFLIQNGYNFRFCQLHFMTRGQIILDKKTSKEFIECLETIDFCYEEFWYSQLTAIIGSPNSYDKSLLKYVAEKIVIKPNFSTEWITLKCIQNGCLSRLKYLYSLGIIKPKMNRNLIRYLANSNISVVHFLNKKFPTIASIFNNQDFIDQLIRFENYPLFRYLLQNNHLEIESPELYQSSLDECTNLSIIEYFKKKFPSQLIK